MTYQAPDLYLSDIHGEYEAFSHVLRNASGTLRLELEGLFGGELDPDEIAELATLIYYPQAKLQLMGEEAVEKYRPCLLRAATHFVANVVQGAEIVELCDGIRIASVHRLHMLGDVYDRGPSPDLIMDELTAFPNIDIQWGNHDILWMGAALGQPGSVCNVVRICARYGNLSILEKTYGMDLSALRAFAAEAYADDPCVAFCLKGTPDLPADELELTVKIQKAMAIIQFKVEAALIAENPSFGLEDRNLLHRIDRQSWTVKVDGEVYEMIDKVLPTVDPDDPYTLTQGEAAVVEALCAAFTGCERLQRHTRFFLEAGSLYKIVGNNLLFHACVPLNADGSLKEADIYGEKLKGKALFDAVDSYVRAAYLETDPAARKRGLDLLWYLWLGEGSPLFAKSKMATFELYFIAEKAARTEVKNPFYKLIEDPAVLAGIFNDFGMDPDNSRILCGHVPVKVKDGEDPVKCGGKALIIDGGFSHAYQKTTGVAGFTVIERGDEMMLATHEPLESATKAIEQNIDMIPALREI